MSASYLAVFLVVLAALSVAAFLFFARSAHETLEPLLALPEGQAAYAAALRRAGITIALFDLPLATIVGVAAYILARVSVRPLLAARQREERFAADAAHELRTPLATIASVAQAARGSEPAAQDRALETIAAVALDASGLLGDLLTLMRDTPAESRLTEPVDLAALAGGVVRDARASAGPIAIALTSVGSAYIIGDARALRQLATNLIENAVRHARTSVAVTIQTDARSVALWVEDDGAGVAPADRERIFERFFKADADTAGSGLGLAIARHIAVRHGGSLQLHGAARFIAHFPQAPLE